MYDEDEEDQYNNLDENYVPFDYCQCDMIIDCLIKYNKKNEIFLYEDHDSKNPTIIDVDLLEYSNDIVTQLKPLLTEKQQISCQLSCSVNVIGQFISPYNHIKTSKLMTMNNFELDDIIVDDVKLMINDNYNDLIYTLNDNNINEWIGSDWLDLKRFVMDNC